MRRSLHILTEYALAIVCMLPITKEGLAQSLPISWEEEFEGNDNSWQQTEKRLASADISDGKLQLKIISSSRPTIIAPCEPPYVDFTSDYEIEVQLRVINEGDYLDCGIVWGGRYIREKGSRKCFDGLSYSNGVMIGKRGVRVFSNGTWRASLHLLYPDILSAEESSVLRIVSKSGEVQVYVNETEITSFVQNPIQGMRLGIIAEGSGTVEVEYIRLYQQLPPIKLPPDYPKDISLKSVGPNINSPYSELAPLITADGQVMYFVRDGHPDNIGNQDIWYSVRQPDQSWGPAQNIGRPLNNRASNGVISVTPDGNQLLLMNTYTSTGEPKGIGISRTRRILGGWGVPEEVVIEDYYNEDRYAEHALDPTGNVLIMTLRRKDTRGERDLYVCFKKPDGTFSAPRWCGPTVCTWGDETSPFIAADGITLYFSTDGLRGYGGKDIWMTRRLDDSWTRWSPPVNLGPSINISTFDAYFTIPAKGAYAYLVSFDPENDEDIYEVELPPGAGPTPVVLISGRVMDRTTGKPIAARVYYEQLSQKYNNIDRFAEYSWFVPRRILGEAWTDPRDGSFKIAVPQGGVYGFRAEAEGYYPISENIDTRNLNRYVEFGRDLVLVPVRRGAIIRLNNLFFDFGSAELRPESYSELERLRLFLIENPRYKVEIAGHTDDIGSEETNLELSRRRAEAVASYLIYRGVEPSRLRVVGYGESRPLVPNISEENRALNRRVEFTLLE